MGTFLGSWGPGGYSIGSIPRITLYAFRSVENCVGGTVTNPLE